MARRIKSLHHNKEEGKDIPQHREHRSKKGREWSSRNIFSKLKKTKLEKEKLLLLDKEIKQIII